MNIESAIKSCLRQKHSKDLVVEECKNGSTTMGSHLRMDMWVMPRSWTKPACTAYEIKVSRSDFLRDEKWPGYLDLCNSFYFACPSGLIQPEELPDSVGLMWLSKTGTRMYTKRKAPQRDVTIPESLWRYVLMCRATIESERRFQTDRDYWEQWLEHERVDQEFGRHVGETIRRRVDEEVIKANKRSERLEKAISEYEEIRRMISEVTGMEIDIERPPSVFAFRRHMEALQEVVPPNLRHEMRRLSERLSGAVDTIEKIEAGKDEAVS